MDWVSWLWPSGEPITPQTALTFSCLIKKKSAKRNQDSGRFAQKTTNKRLKTPQTRFFVPSKLKQGCFLTAFSPCFLAHRPRSFTH